jgi:hypothetical protein
VSFKVISVGDFTPAAAAAVTSCQRSHIAKISALMQSMVQDIRIDVLMALDPRVMTKQEATSLILLTSGFDSRAPQGSTRGCFHSCWGLTPSCFVSLDL